MQIDLPPDQQSFLDGLIATGTFSSQSAAISEAVRLLQAQNQLKKELALGIEDADANRLHSHETVFKELRAKLANLNQSS